MELFGKRLLAIEGIAPEDKAALLQLVGLTVSKIVASASGATESESNAAAITAKLAVENNWLKHQEKEDLAKFKAACNEGKGNEEACEQKSTSGGIGQRA